MGSRSTIWEFYPQYQCMDQSSEHASTGGCSVFLFRFQCWRRKSFHYRHADSFILPTKSPFLDCQSFIWISTPFNWILPDRSFTSSSIFLIGPPYRKAPDFCCQMILGYCKFDLRVRECSSLVTMRLHKLSDRAVWSDPWGSSIVYTIAEEDPTSTNCPSQGVL